MNTANLKLNYLLITAAAFTFSCFAQEHEEFPLVQIDGQPLDKQQVIEELLTPPPLQGRVLAAAIAPEEIDQAVLNRLLQEIIRSPEVAKIRLGVDDIQLQDIFVAVSNARNFINGSEMQNVQAMCKSWKQSSLAGDTRIKQALEAYEARAQRTRNFVAKYYRVVLSEIDANLGEQAKTSFNNYMDDRRGRMANSGVVSSGLAAQNLYNGAEAISFHCRT